MVGPGVAIYAHTLWSSSHFASSLYVFQVQVCSYYVVIKSGSLHAAQCPQTGNRNGLPSFQNNRGSNRFSTITAGRQAIIPSYKLVCEEMCGNITEWGVDVDREIVEIRESIP
jgi:hypothetical protein